MNRLMISGWMSLCVLAATAFAADDPLLDHPIFPMQNAVVTIDPKTTASAMEILSPCFAREHKDGKLEVSTTKGWGWVDRKQMMTVKEAEKYCEEHKKEAYGLYLRSVTHLVKEAANDAEMEKNLGKAMADLNAALKIDPKFSPALASRGTLLAEKGEFEKASADFDAAVKAGPDDLQAANELAWFRATCPEAKFRDGKKAIAEATRVCESTKFEYDEYLDTLAAAYAEAGDFKNALKWITKAAEIDPENADYKEHTKLYKAKRPLRDGQK